MDKKIIAISSTHGTGKSTLAYNFCAELKKKGKNVVVLDELARICPFEINQGADHKTQIWLICKQIVKELELMGRFEYVIVDRSVMDAFAYAVALGIMEPNFSYAFIADHIRTYYHKIYMPHLDEFNYHIYDGLRDMDDNFRTKVFDTLMYMYSIYNIPYTMIMSEDEMINDIGRYL